MDEKIQARVFKTKCLNVIDRVRRTKKKIIITKRNIPVAKLVPIDESEEVVFGKLKGTVHFNGDIIAPTGEVWNMEGPFFYVKKNEL